MSYIVQFSLSVSFLDTSLYTALCTPLYISFFACTLMQCLSDSLQSLYGELTINHQPILFKANLLSCLSTTVGLVHEPPLPNGVVNLQQPKFGTQCGAYGWWTGPYTHNCNTQMLGVIASHPQLRTQHHQLAHVSWPVADAWSCTKKTISFNKRTLVNIWHLQWGWQADIGQCTTPLHTQIEQEDSAQLPTGDTVSGIATIHSIPRGECGDNKETHNKEGSSTFIPRSTGSLSREVVPGPTHEGKDYTVNLVIVPGALNSNSARGTEHCKCQGHWTFVVPWAHMTIVVSRNSVWIGTGQSNLFIFICHGPHSRSELGLVYLI